MCPTHHHGQTSLTTLAPTALLAWRGSEVLRIFRVFWLHFSLPYPFSLVVFVFTANLLFFFFFSPGKSHLPFLLICFDNRYQPNNSDNTSLFEKSLILACFFFSFSSGSSPLYENPHQTCINLNCRLSIVKSGEVRAFSKSQEEEKKGMQRESSGGICWVNCLPFLSRASFFWSVISISVIITTRWGFICGGRLVIREYAFLKNEEKKRRKR